ncbi:MAG: hypothetical protein JOZ62_20175 [Acidobacteriaceae bacterium]|nr:hypothetical protein [Acidobacteriaceae bacterium]
MGSAQQRQLDYLNHNRPVLDAHNCYPYDGLWNDRIDRALGTGLPVAIEQDLAWHVDAAGQGHVVVAHDAKTTGNEPLLRDYFFERVRPIVERALADGRRDNWPLIVLHFDFKDNQAPLLHAVWELLGSYESWIVTAPKTRDARELAPFDVRPLLVLTEESDAQEQVFFREIPEGQRLRIFGSAHTNNPPTANGNEAAHVAASLPPEQLLTERPTNYRRWWNNSWAEIEEGGQNKAGDWNPAEMARLRAFVEHAHRLGYWIRFYTLDGFQRGRDRGWFDQYNFGSPEAVRTRWRACIQAGVNLIATDQYEDLAALMRESRSEGPQHSWK